MVIMYHLFHYLKKQLYMSADTAAMYFPDCSFVTHVQTDLSETIQIYLNPHLHEKIGDMNPHPSRVYRFHVSCFDSAKIEKILIPTA